VFLNRLRFFRNRRQIPQSQNTSRPSNSREWYNPAE
jgi:hypothetical protein